MVENFVKLENVMELVAKFVNLAIPIEQDQLKQLKLKYYESSSNRKRNCGCRL